MKQVFKYSLAIVALLLVSIGAGAQTAYKNFKLDGVEQTSGTMPGDVQVNFSTRTITVTPGSGNYLTAEDLTVIKVIDGGHALSRNGEPGFNIPVEITPKDQNADPSKTTEYTFGDLGDSNYDLEITANFHNRISVADATVTISGGTSFAYTGNPIMPEVTVVVSGKTLTPNTDYYVYYRAVTDAGTTIDSINAGTKQIWVDGKGKYIDRVTKDYTIEKIDPTLTFSPTSATYTFGQEFTKPTLTTTPAGLAVTYASSNTNVADVNQSTGEITAKVASTEAITITASFAGNDNYNAKNATYALTVAKGTAAVSKAPTAKENLTYTGEAQALINAGEATNGTMQYKIGADGTYSTDIPTGTEAKTYTVYYKAAASNTNQYNDSEEGNFTVTIAKAEPTLTFSPATATYTFGQEFTKPTLTTTPAGLTVTYQSSNTNVASVDTSSGDITGVAASTEAITITASFAGNDNYNAKNATYALTVAKGTAAVSKAPTAKENLTYTGEAQALINAGEATNGTMQYKIGADGTYSTDIPTGTEAKTYTVYYKAAASNANQYNDSEEGKFSVTIGKAEPTLTFSPATATYTFGQEFTKPTLTTTPAGLTVTYQSSNANVAEANATTGDITAYATGSDIIITASFAGNDNYSAKNATYTLTVAKGTAAVSKAPTAVANLTYTGEAQQLIAAGEATNGTMQYMVGENGTYSADIPTGTEVGEYTVFYKAVGDAKFNDSEAGSVKVSIGKAAGTISYATATVNKTYGDQAFTNELTITGDGKVAYSTSDDKVATVNASTGEVNILGSGEATITATVTDGINYTYETKTASYLLSVGTEAMEVSAVAYTGTYDGQSHTITVNAPEDATVKYGTAAGTYNQNTAPAYTDAGTYTVFYQVTKPNFTTVSGSQTVTISKAAGSVSYTMSSISKTFGDGTFTNDLTITGDGTVSYTSSNTTVATVDATTGEVTIAGSGEATITATVTDGTNYTYATKTASYSLNVATTDMNVTATGFEGVYDGDAHGITVTAPEGATVKYGTAEGTYDLTVTPSYTDAGTYTIYYQVSKANYTTVTGSATVTISKAAGSISYATASINKTYGDKVFTNELTNTGDGKVAYSTSDDKVATVDANGEVTIVGDGEATITATVTDGINYTYETKTASYTISVGTEGMEVKAEGFTGTYDGDAHGITVTVTTPEGATVKYGTAEGAYDLDASPTYTNAGIYTIYYQVTKKGYTTVTNSATVTINKAAGTISFAEESINKIFGDEAFTNDLTVIGDGTVTYASSNTDVANVDASGKVTIAGTGTATITATVTEKEGGNYTYETKTTSYTLTVSRKQAEGYALWVGDTQVTEDNRDDILGDSEKDLNGEITKSGSFTFNPEKNILLINNGETDQLIIESRLPELKVYLRCEVVNKLKRIFYNNLGDEENTGKLVFTCENNHPGKLIVANTEGESAIAGFSEISYDWELAAIEPDGAFYQDGQMMQELKDEDGNVTDIAVADVVTIGQVIKPLVENRIITVNMDDFKVMDEDGNLKDADMRNFAVNDILYTLKPDPEQENPDEGLDDTDGKTGIALVSTMTDDEVAEVAESVANGSYVPGGSSYAEAYSGMTFMVPAGEGTIKIEQVVDPGYRFHLKIGTNKPIILESTDSEYVLAEIPFNVEEPTYCYLYLVKVSAAARGITPIGRRDKAHGKVVSIGVSVHKARSANPPSQASGGSVPSSEDPSIDLDDSDGIRDILYTDKDRTGNNRWYNLNGQQVDEPTKKGLYIHNRKKIYIK